MTKTALIKAIDKAINAYTGTDAVLAVGKTCYDMLKEISDIPKEMTLTKYKSIPIKFNLKFPAEELVLLSQADYDEQTKQYDTDDVSTNSHIISSKKKIATKTFPCSACAWLKMKLNPKFMAKLTPREQMTVQKASSRNWMIIRGNSYTEQVTEYLGKRQTAKFQKKIHDICVKYDVYKPIKIN